MFALMLSLTGLFYLCWRVYDLHSFAVGPTSGFSEAPNVLAPVVIVDPGTGSVAQSCAFDSTKGFARLEPQTDGRLMLGLSLDWSHDTPLKIQAKMNGVTPAVFSAWLQLDPATFNGDGYDKNSLNWFGSECGRTGSILEITIECSVPLSQVPQVMYDAVGADLTAINTKYGVPVLFRWNHEMNGDWTIYGYQPTAYVDSFKKMAAAVRARTNMTGNASVFSVFLNAILSFFPYVVSYGLGCKCWPHVSVCGRWPSDLAPARNT
ncbi:hypothetical protein BC830DRAFT_1130967 [Chytriomyces sp. MP71]|nr:hypothetical protein BC830DRAFT_1130967 [Chytriomyces sp. MP71]